MQRIQEIPIEIPDQEVRDTIRDDLSRCFLVEASAGSGKTHCLVERIVSLVRRGVAEVDRIAAITFTVKAAGELKGRFQNRLEEVLQECEAGAEEFVRLEDALSRLDQSFIGTIHAFCGRLLRERPVEAGLDPDFREGDELQIELLKRETWQSYIEDVHLGLESLPDSFNLAGLSLLGLNGLYEQLSEYDDVEFEREAMECPHEPLAEALRATFAFMDDANSVMPDHPPPGRAWEGLQENLLRALAVRAHMDIDDTAEIVRFLELFETGDVKHFVVHNDGGKRTRVPLWATAADGKRIHVAVNELRTSHLMPALNAWRAYCYPIALDSVQPAVDRFRQRRRESGILSFQDLLIESARLLRDSPAASEVRRYFQTRFSHILVDEFQDTDPIQAEVMFLLSGDDVEEKDWTRSTPRPGSLFVVGDPKQSIYRFRRADISVYDLVKRKFGSDVLTLSATFRISKSLCDRIDPPLQGLIEKHRSPFQAEYTPLQPVRPESSDDPVRYLYYETVTGLPGDNTKNYRVALKDAEAIACLISDMTDWSLTLCEDEVDGAVCKRSERIARWGDFLILTRQKTHLPIYAAALEKLGIPHRVSGANAFKGREISPLMNLLTAIADPENSVALVAYLRDGLVGVSDEELYQFKTAGGTFDSLWSMLQKSEELSKTIHQAGLHLRRGVETVREVLPSVAIERILDESGLLPLTRSQEGGGSRSGSLLKVISLARRMEREGLTFIEIVDRLKEIQERRAGDYTESLSLHPTQEDAVTLMNLHKAKGLEARVVFLADPRTLTWHAPQLHVERTGVAARGHLKIQGKRSDGSDGVIGHPLEWDRLEQVETEFQKAEENRLIYVAATRAKDVLIISQYHRSKSSQPHKDAAPDRPWEPLFNRIREPLKLTAPPAPSMEYEALTGEVSRERFQKTAQQNRDFIRTQTYAHMTAHELAADAVQRAAGDEDRIGGAQWGTVIHRLLADCATFDRAPSDILARKYLVEEGLSDALVSDALIAVEAVRESTVWKRLAASDSRYVEVPFAMKLQPGEEEELELQGATTGFPTLFKGTIDLAFRENGEWVIVDYKTDATSGRLDALLNHYRPQVSFYGRAWKKLTGEPVKETALHFLDGSQYVVVD